MLHASSGRGSDYLAGEIAEDEFFKVHLVARVIYVITEAAV
jgi:hypothetical protein